MVTLEATKQAFDKWRAAKTKGNAPVPSALWDMVEQLLSIHKISEICKILRISSKQIKAYCIAIPTNKNQELQSLQSNGDEFVETISTISTGMSELTIKGNSKSLHLCLPTSALREVLPVLGDLL